MPEERRTTERRRILPPPTNETTGEPSFRWRRIGFFLIVGVCFIYVPAIAFLPPIPDTEINRDIVRACFDLVGWSFTIYAFGAGLQDGLAIWRTGSARPYAPPPGKVETTETKIVETKVEPAPTPATDPNNPPAGFAQ